MAGSATITGRQNYVLGIGHPSNEATTEQQPATAIADSNGKTVALSAGGQTGLAGGFTYFEKPKDINIHGAMLEEPMKIIDLPSPYFLNGTTTKKEHAYGTPIYFENGWNGYKFWMVGAPYPTTESLPLASFKYENPCVYVSQDGENWSVPSGLTNPIATSIGLSDANSYYADPYITASPDNSKLYVIWYWTNRTGTIKSSLLISESTDGVTWSAPVSIYDSTSTSFQPNSPSLFWNGNGWTVLIVETGTGFNIQRMTTPSPTPYTGWSAFSAVTAPHPASRNWWHAHFVPIGGGVVIGMASDNNSAGGTGYTLKSSNGGVSFSVQPFSAYNGSVAGGTWYRPSLCVMTNGIAHRVAMYVSRIGPLYGAGFWVGKALLSLAASTVLGAKDALRDMVQRKVTTPINTLKRSLLAWDSFQRADSATTLGNSDGGIAWTQPNTPTNVWGINSNRAYQTSTGNCIAVLDVASSDYEFEFQIQTMGTQLNIMFGYIDGSNFYRVISSGAVQRIISGGIDKAYGNISPWTLVAGDIIGIRKNGEWVTIYLNDRPQDSIQLNEANDAALKSSTKIGMQASGASASYITNFIARVPSA